MKTWKNPTELLDYLNTTYASLHTSYENLFWVSYMGDSSAAPKKDMAQAKREVFRTDNSLKMAVDNFITTSKGEIKERLIAWSDFFSRYQTPEQLKPLRNTIGELETKIETKRSSFKEGYVHPTTKAFTPLSRNGMLSLMITDNDEGIRKACFEALEKIALSCVDDYVELVALRNTFAQKQGFTDFYAYKLSIEEKMTKKDLFSLFDEIYQKTKYALTDIKALEKSKPGLRKPWNFSYMMSSSFVKESDQYFPFEEAVGWWAASFERLGIGFRGGKLVLDLLDREGKYNNGFCHWPVPVQYKNGTRMPAIAQFTCTTVLGIPGQSLSGLHTLFHEGGHAAHLLNADMKDICLNIEYPPASTAWDETQSMFLDTISSSIEWRMRYAKNAKGEAYPFDLFVRTSKALHVLRPMGMNGIIMVANFEKAIYEEKNLTAEKAIAIARKVYKKYMDRSEDSLLLLDVPHIYSWESACSYHGYGLAELALNQWREYFFKKYGYIVDNPHIGKEMQRVWKNGAKYSFLDSVKLATGKKLSPTAYLKNATKSFTSVQKTAKERIARLEKVKLAPTTKGLDATIVFVHGKKVIATTEHMTTSQAVQTYKEWIKKQYKK